MVCICVHRIYSFIMLTCRWMDSDDRSITDWTHRPSGGDLLESTHPQVLLWCRVSQLATAMWRRIRIAPIGERVEGGWVWVWGLGGWGGGGGVGGRGGGTVEFDCALSAG